MRITAHGSVLKIEVNGAIAHEVDLDKIDPASIKGDKEWGPKNLKRRRGRIGLQYSGKEMKFRNIQVRELRAEPVASRSPIAGPPSRALRIGGKVRVFVAGKEVDIKSLDEVENKPFRVVTVEFFNNPLADDAGLENLKGLTELRLHPVRKHKVTGSGFVHLAGMRSLDELDTNTSPVDDAGVRHLAGLPALRQVWLRNSKVTDEAAEHLVRIKSLVTIGLDGTGFTDAGLSKLKDLPQLKILDLRRVAKVTDAGISELRKALPGLQVNR